MTELLHPKTILVACGVFLFPLLIVAFQHRSEFTDALKPDPTWGHIIHFTSPS